MSRPTLRPQDLPTGIRLAGRGLRGWAGTPKLMLLGAIPAVLVWAIFLALIVLVVPRTPAIARWATPFAADWSLLAREVLQVTLAIAMSVALIYLAIVTFVSVTLLVGSWFYERIWAATEERLGGLEQRVELNFRATVGKTVDDTGRSVLMALTTAALAFLIGLVPVVGSIAAAVFVTYRGARSAAIELTAFAGDARGWSFAQRRRRIDRRPLLMLGTALPYYLSFLVPGLAIVTMPAGVVSGTHLVRTLVEGETPPSTPDDEGPYWAP